MAATFDTVYVVCLYCIIYANSLIIWELDFSEYCNNPSWTCFNSDGNTQLVNKSSDECGYQFCAKYTETDYTRIHNISTLNHNDLKFDYTLSVLSLDDQTEIFSIEFARHNQTINIAEYNSDTLFNKTNFTTNLAETLWNQSSITLNFNMDGSGSGDIAYLYNAVIYNDVPTNPPSIQTGSNDDSISFGADYEDLGILCYKV